MASTLKRQNVRQSKCPSSNILFDIVSMLPGDTEIRFELPFLILMNESCILLGFTDKIKILYVCLFEDIN